MDALHFPLIRRFVQSIHAGVGSYCSWYGQYGLTDSAAEVGVSGIDSSNIVHPSNDAVFIIMISLYNK